MSIIEEIQKQKQRMGMAYEKEIKELKNKIEELEKENRILTESVNTLRKYK